MRNKGGSSLKKKPVEISQEGGKKGTMGGGRGEPLRGRPPPNGTAKTMGSQLKTVPRKLGGRGLKGAAVLVAEKRKKAIGTKKIGLRNTKKGRRIRAGFQHPCIFGTSLLLSSDKGGSNKKLVIKMSQRSALT